MAPFVISHIVKPKPVHRVSVASDEPLAQAEQRNIAAAENLATEAKSDKVQVTVLKLNIDAVDADEARADRRAPAAS